MIINRSFKIYVEENLAPQHVSIGDTVVFILLKRCVINIVLDHPVPPSGLEICLIWVQPWEY